MLNYQITFHTILVLVHVLLLQGEASAFFQSTSGNPANMELHQNQQQSPPMTSTTAVAKYNKQSSSIGQQHTTQSSSSTSPSASPALTNPLIISSMQKAKSKRDKSSPLSMSGHHKLNFNTNKHQTTSSDPTQQQQPNNKTRHHIVNKIKDARHRRRRHRQQRHRHYRRHQAQPIGSGAGQATMGPDGKVLSGDQLIQFQQFKSMIEKQQQQQQSHSSPLDSTQNSPSLTALESIVEEVARAGQQLVSTGVQVLNGQSSTGPNASLNQGSRPPMGSSSAALASDLLLDGSTAAVQHVKSTPNPQLPAPTSSGANAANPALGSSTASSTRNQQQVDAYPQHPISLAAGGGTGIRGGNPLNSRGFFLTTMLSKIMNVLNVTEFAIEMRDGISSRASCMACNAVVGLFLSPLYSKEVFSAAIRTVCTSFKIQSPRVCAGVAESFQDDLDYIRKNTRLTRDEVCGVVFGIDCARRPTYNLFWTVPIPHYPSKQQQLLDQQQQQTNNADPSRPPLSEASLLGMEDGPDLFEYRRGGHSNKEPASSAANSSSQSSELKSRSSHGADQSAAASSKLQEKTASSKASPGPSKQRSSHGHNKQTLDSNDKSEVPVPLPSDPTRAKLKISSFVQITDIHIDPYYEPGSLSDCKEPLCCRATSGHVQAGDKRRQAGRWGDYGNCDLPVRTLRSALQRIREHHPNAEYWLWTGDISPHDIWNISKNEAANDVRLVTQMVREYSNGLPVFPVIGNHEAHPVNSFSPPEIKGRFSMSWLYDLLAEEWSDWLPKDALETLRIGGYYKLQVRKGFRIIALNTNYCARLNPWSFYDPVDPANQLRWLVDELLEAELNGDRVHIIGHVPPDNRECTQAWLFNFINIVDRFKETIEAQFYGHTHRDEFRIMYSLKAPTSFSGSSSSSSQSNGSSAQLSSAASSGASGSASGSGASGPALPSYLPSGEEPVGVQFIGPSLTPFTENNPAYRIYHQDQAGRLVNAETYFFNLTEANERPDEEPRWQFSYATQRHLNMTGLRAHDWHHYVQKLYEDESLFDSFFRNFYRASDVKGTQVCRYKCKHQILSDLRLSHPYKTKPKPFLANRKTSNHNHHHHHHQPIHHLHHLHNKRLRYSERSKRHSKA